MQGFLVKIFVAIGYKAASTLAGLAWDALYEAFTDRSVNGAEEKLEVTQEERRAILKTLQTTTDKVQRRHLMSLINKLR